MKVFAIYDSKASAYLLPFFLPTAPQALRAFDDAVNDPSTAFNRHPEDYTLFELGEFDDQSGTLTPHEAKISVATAIELKINS